MHLREELEYDMYFGENYKACHYGKDHWQHQPDVEKLLAEFERTMRSEQREPHEGVAEIFEANRFRKNHACRMVLATFWRLMSGFMAVNVGMKIPGIQTKLKALADLPEQVQILSAKSSGQDGMLSLVRRAVHLFNMIMGKVVGSNGYRVACRHQFTAYNLFFGAPLIFCTPNIADNRNILILLTQGEEINLDIDADPDLKVTYEELRLRVVNDPVGQRLVVELLLRLFVLHILGASPDSVAQPEGIAANHQKWFSDGVAASLTSLGCLCILLASRGELEASGRGSLHGHWEIWALSALIADALARFSDKPAAERLRLMKRVVYDWINFFQRTHHSSAQHLPMVFQADASDEPMIVTQDMLRRCRMDGQTDAQAGYCPQPRPQMTSIPPMDLPKKLPVDNAYEPADTEPEPSDTPADTVREDTPVVDPADSAQPLPADSALPPPPNPVAGARRALPSMTKKPIRGQALTALPSYRRINSIRKGATSSAELPASDWLAKFAQDAWQMQARAMLHVCGPSCWKYNKSGASSPLLPYSYVAA